MTSDEMLFPENDVSLSYMSRLKCNPKYIMSSKDIKVVIGGVLKRNRYDFSQLGCLINLSLRCSLHDARHLWQFFEMDRY